jgi:hypothetical protein
LDIPNAAEAADLALIASAKETALPAIVVQYPHEFGQDDPVFTTPWDANSVARLVGSPLRSELSQRLAAGQTAVWLVLSCGDAQKDEAAIATLTEELKRLEADLKLPEQTAEDALETEQFGGPSVRIEFSVLSVSRTGADEALVAMLLHSESDLPELTDPLVFPVFGRGRALLPLVGAGITPPNIAEYAEFLVGACSCQVKEQNPGFDLLLTADWNRLLQDAGAKPATTVSPNSPVASEPELVPIPSGAAAPQATAKSPSKDAPRSPSTSEASVTPAAIENVASAATASAPNSPASGVAPWLAGAAAFAVVVMLVVWRRTMAARART